MSRNKWSRCTKIRQILLLLVIVIMCSSCGSTEVREEQSMESETHVNSMEVMHYQELASYLSQARKLYTSYKKGDSAGEVPQEAFEALIEAGALAIKVIEERMDQQTADRVTDQLKEAIRAFKDAIIVAPNYEKLAIEIANVEKMMEDTDEATLQSNTKYKELYTAYIASLELYRSQQLVQDIIDSMTKQLVEAYNAFMFAWPIDQSDTEFQWVRENQASITQQDGYQQALMPVPTSMVFSEVNPNNMVLSMRVPKDNAFTWLGFTVSQGGASRLDANGFTAIMELTGNLQIRFVNVDGNLDWGNSKMIYSGKPNALKNGLNDGEWHDYALTRTEDGFVFSVDGQDLFAAAYTDLDADLVRLFAAGKITLTLYTDGARGTVELAERG